MRFIRLLDTQMPCDVEMRFGWRLNSGRARSSPEGLALRSANTSLNEPVNSTLAS